MVLVPFIFRISDRLLKFRQSAGHKYQYQCEIRMGLVIEFQVNAETREFSYFFVLTKVVDL